MASTSLASSRYERGRAWYQKGRRWFVAGVSLNIITLGAIPIQFAVDDPFWSITIAAVGVLALGTMFACYWRQRVCNRRAKQVWGTR